MGMGVVPAIRLLEIRIRWEVREILLNLFLYFYKSGRSQQNRRKATRHGATEPSYSSLTRHTPRPSPLFMSTILSSPPFPRRLRWRMQRRLRRRGMRRRADDCGVGGCDRIPGALTFLLKIPIRLRPSKPVLPIQRAPRLKSRKLRRSLKGQGRSGQVVLPFMSITARPRLPSWPAAWQLLPPPVRIGSSHRRMLPK
jgi:hypothetical protein